ncbi:DUF2939 domain-containing protein [Erythrobacter westpacificensis]|uniref:DUF2939 domain-containing protein n=1 Tax=Erythrobacter westpacificensis TaxID=1055231 RepID=A0ABP9KLB9_9SPHN
MKKLLALLLLVGLAFGGWYFASPYLALNGLQEAVRSGDRAEIERRVDFPALRASAADQLTELARRRIEQGVSIRDLRDLAGEVLRRSDGESVPTPNEMVDILLSESLATDLVPEALQGPPLEFDIEREGLDHFRAVGTLADGTEAPDLIFERDGFGWVLTGFELP